MKLGTLWLAIRARTKDYEKDLDRSERMTRSKGKAMSGALLGVAAAATAMSLAMAKGVKAASDLEEVSNKFNVVFRGQEKIAERWAKTLVNSYAMSTREAKQYLAAMQDLLKPMGIAPRQAAELSNEIVKLSADLASFNNMQTADVMRDIQSALVGNYETVRKYGAMVSAVTVEQKVFEMGLATTKKEITAADKALAAYNIILESNADAVGDVARSSGSYAKAMKEFNANLEDFYAELGNTFLPMITGALEGITDLMKGMRNAFADAKSELKGLADAIRDDKVLYQLFSRERTVAAGRPMFQMRDLAAELGMGAGAGAILGQEAGGGPKGVPSAEAPIDTMMQWFAEKRNQEELLNAETARMNEENLLAKQEMLDREMEIYRQYYAARKQEHDAHQQQLVAADQAAKANREALQTGLMGTLMNIAQVGGKKMFAWYKRIKTAQALVDAYSAINQVWSDPSLLTTASKIAMSAFVASKAFANVAAIQGMGMGGGGGASGGGGGGGSVPNLPTQTEERGNLTINISGQIFGNDEFVDDLVDKINKAGDREVFIAYAGEAGAVA